MKRLKKCPLENGELTKKESSKKHDQSWCYLKGMVECESCDVQDCNIKRVKKCPLEGVGR